MLIESIAGATAAYLAYKAINEKHIKKIKKLADDYVKKFNKKVSKEGSVVFIGQTNAGKTVYFVAMVDQLLRHSEGKYKITYKDSNTERFVIDNIAKMKKSGWPLHTVNEALYEIDLNHKSWGMNHTGTISFHDHPGDSFEVAFSDPSKKSELSTYAGDALILRKELIEAKGIILVIDSAVLHEGQSAEFREVLFNLTTFLKEVAMQNGKKRIAVIFAKADLFKGHTDFHPSNVFRDQYTDAYNKLAFMEVSYYYASAVGEHIINTEGEMMPPSDYNTSKAYNVIEPVLWLLDIKEKDIK